MHGCMQCMKAKNKASGKTVLFSVYYYYHWIELKERKSNFAASKVNGYMENNFFLLRAKKARRICSVWIGVEVT